MSKKYLYLDFEYNGTNEEKLNLVSCVLSLDGVNTKRYWLHNNKAAQYRLATDLLTYKDEGYIFVAWAVTAEAGSIYSLGIDPTQFTWLDLHLEYRMLTNHCHRYMYGRQLISGKIKTTSPPASKYFKTEDDFDDSSKPQHNLAAGTFKMLNIQIDSIHKEEMRELIISSPSEFTSSEMTSILDYNESDIKYLPLLREAIFQAYRNDRNGLTTTTEPLIPRNEQATFYKEMLWRGEYAARTAVMERIGYPVNVEWVTNFYSKSNGILEDIMSEINELFPEIKPFEFNKRTGRFVRKEDRIFKWIDEKSGLAHKWARTAGGKYSLSQDVVTKFFSYSHSYPKDSFGAQLARLLKTRQSLYGFLPPSPTAKDKTTFLDYIGSDGRVRSYFGIYGAQSGRNQPSSKSFIPLKTAWLRSLIVPPKGKAICGIDYSSQEFLLMAIYYNDKNAIEAYKSGDVYLYFAKLDGAVPMDGKKEDYSEIRELYKSTVLGLLYLMTKTGLAIKLSHDTGKQVTEDDAQLFIDKFDKAFPVIYAKRARVFEEYKRRGYMKLPCGWYMYSDNANERSTANMPIQGLGSSILRKFVELSQRAGLKIIYTLHDAGYIEYDSEDFSAIDKLEECMREAFVHYFKGTEMEIVANLIRMDAKAWSIEYGDSGAITPKGLKVETQTIFVDKRSRTEYEQFKGYLTGE